MNVLEAVGNAVIQGLAYVGGLTMQFLSELRASPRVLPLTGKRGRWKTAMQQMAAIGVDGLPIIAIMSVCAGFILAMQTGSELRRFGALRHGRRWRRVHGSDHMRTIGVGIFSGNRNHGSDQRNRCDENNGDGSHRVSAHAEIYRGNDHPPLPDHYEQHVWHSCGCCVHAHHHKHSVRNVHAIHLQLD